MKIYFDIYERILALCAKSPRAYCQSTATQQSLLQELGAYSVLRSIPLEHWNRELLQRFVTDTLDAPGDTLAQILAVPDPVRRRGLVECYYEMDAIREALMCIALPEMPRQELLEDRKAAILAPGVAESLFGITLTRQENVLLHISSAAPYALTMFTLLGCGTLLTVGIQASIAKQEQKTRQDYLVACKAMGDESRLQIVCALQRQALTVTEIAQQVGLTLPTVNHHIKALMHAGIVAWQTGQEAGRGARYTINRASVHQFLQGLEDWLREEEV